MKHGSPDTRLPAALRLFLGLAGLIVAFGSGLLLLPTLIEPLWPWTMSSFGAGFLGAVYTAELILDIAILVINQRALLRLALVLSLGFTGSVSLVTLLHTEMFNPARPTTPLWYVAYGGSVIILIYALIRERASLPTGVGTAPVWRIYLGIQGTLLLVYGLAVLLIPGTATAFWPWKMEIFAAQMYCAIFISGGIGSLVLAGRATALELRLLGLTQLSLGVLVLIGLLIADAASHWVVWSAPGTWLYVAIFGLLATSGGLLLRQSYQIGRQPRPAVAHS